MDAIEGQRQLQDLPLSELIASPQESSANRQPPVEQDQDRDRVHDDNFETRLMDIEHQLQKLAKMKRPKPLKWKHVISRPSTVMPFFFHLFIVFFICLYYR